MELQINYVNLAIVFVFMNGLALYGLYLKKKEERAERENKEQENN